MVGALRDTSLVRSAVLNSNDGNDGCKRVNGVGVLEYCEPIDIDSATAVVDA